ncbi:MAG TPA: DNA repair protein RecO [Candidatus Binatia bacterium]|jgi:DNA repair protein RecO (recombination protein O)
MEETVTSAFVLRGRNFGESDRIVVLLTEAAGKISAIAKGARRSTRRFAGGALEPFQELQVRLDRKSQFSLAFLHESRVLGSNRALAANLDAYAWGSYLTELAELMTADRDPCPDLYELYRDVVSRLGRDAVEPLAHHFVLGLLDRSGWAPDFDACGICAEPVTEYSRPILDSRGSGVICARHEAEAAGVDPSSGSFRPSRRVIDPELMAYVREAAARVPPQASPDVARLATALLERLVDLHLQKPLRSRAFLKSLAREFADGTNQTDENADKDASGASPGDLEKKELT